MEVITIRKFLIRIILSTTVGVSWVSQSQAEPLKEFIKACTYGVLAGTLVGTASLAFTSKPGDNLGNIARGASLGLYAGMALGAYVIYFVPAQGEKRPEDINLDQLPDSEGTSEEDGASHTPEPSQDRLSPGRLSLGPAFNSVGKIDGVVASWNYSF